MEYTPVKDLSESRKVDSSEADCAATLGRMKEPATPQEIRKAATGTARRGLMAILGSILGAAWSLSRLVRCSRNDKKSATPTRPVLDGVYQDAVSGGPVMGGVCRGTGRMERLDIAGTAARVQRVMQVCSARNGSLRMRALTWNESGTGRNGLSLKTAGSLMAALVCVMFAVASGWGNAQLVKAPKYSGTTTDAVNAPTPVLALPPLPAAKTPNGTVVEDVVRSRETIRSSAAVTSSGRRLQLEQEAQQQKSAAVRAADAPQRHAALT